MAKQNDENACQTVTELVEALRKDEMEIQRPRRQKNDDARNFIRLYELAQEDPAWSMSEKLKGIDVNLKLARMIYHDPVSGKTRFSAIPCGCLECLVGNFKSCLNFDPIVNEVHYAKTTQSQKTQQSEVDDNNHSAGDKDLDVLPSLDTYLDHGFDFEKKTSYLPLDEDEEADTELSYATCPDSPASIDFQRQKGDPDLVISLAVDNFEGEVMNRSDCEGFEPQNPYEQVYVAACSRLLFDNLKTNPENTTMIMNQANMATFWIKTADHTDLKDLVKKAKKVFFTPSGTEEYYPFRHITPKQNYTKVSKNLSVEYSVSFNK